MELLIIAGIDISHLRLVDLTRLADQAKPFYDWVTIRFQTALLSNASLEQLLLKATSLELKLAIAACYQVTLPLDLPFLFDGVGRTYPHTKACYYFFSWLIRDAPQQRLAPLIQRIMRASAKSRTEVEIEVLTALIIEYRDHVQTFSWEAVREVIIDRLEGSRRSIKGHEKEAIVRTALLVAIQAYYDTHKGYGVFSGIEIPANQVMIGNESYDVSVNLLDSVGEIIGRILMPIKTRETEGGGHAHLFTRDILSAINAAKITKKNTIRDYIAVIIVAKNWSQREAATLRVLVDHLALFDLAPSEFSIFDDAAQLSLNHFVATVFDGTASTNQSAQSIDQQ
ncbi:MAG: hypothetical protein H7Y11_02140 [Armatimonadetes bacterium]|nr:hypothetical protein [Anaerolineae bacterium]